MEEIGYYNYSIDKIAEDSKNKDILDIYYGRRPYPFTFKIYKKDAVDFLKAILSEEEMKEVKIEEGDFESGEIINTLNFRLAGKGMIVISGTRNCNEYHNGTQNRIKKIVGINLDGKIEEDKAFDYDGRKPSIDDLLKNDGDER